MIGLNTTSTRVNILSQNHYNLTGTTACLLATPPSDAGGMWRDAAIALVLFLAPVALCAAMIKWSTSDTWGTHICLFTSGWFLYQFFSQTFVERFFRSRSTLFARLPRPLQRQDARYIIHIAVSLTLYFPVGVSLGVRLFKFGPDQFLPYVDLSRCVLLMGISGEMLDLACRCNVSVSLGIHHAVELIGGAIMVDASLITFEPGFLLLAFTAVTGRIVWITRVLDRVRRGGRSDVLFHERVLSAQDVGFLYFVSGVWIIACGVVQPAALVAIYVGVYGGDLTLSSKAMLFVLTPLFIVVDIPVIHLFFARSRVPKAVRGISSSSVGPLVV